MFNTHICIYFNEWTLAYFIAKVSQVICVLKSGLIIFHLVMLILVFFFLIADKIPIKTKEGRLVWARSLRRDTIHRGGEGMVEEAAHDP